MARPKKPVSPEVEAARARNAETARIVAAHPLTIATAKQAAADKALSAFVAGMRNIRRAEWEAAGGCTRCNGTGQVHERRQGSDWTDWYPCSNEDKCTSNTIGVPAGANLGHEVRGFNMKNPVEHKPTVDRSYCNVHATVTIAPLLSSPSEISAYDDLVEDDDSTAREHNMFERMYAIARGVEVIVIGGRKLPQGTRGIVTWIGQNNPEFGGGTRIGLKTDNGANGKLVYCDPDRVLVLTPAIDWEATEMLYGSFKQQQWAGQIRQDAIRNGHVFDWHTSDEITRKNHQTAGYWIEKRELFAKPAPKSQAQQIREDLAEDQHASAMLAMLENG